MKRTDFRAHAFSCSSFQTIPEAQNFKLGQKVAEPRSCDCNVAMMLIRALLNVLLLLARPPLVHSDALLTTYNLFYDGILSASSAPSSEQVVAEVATDILKSYGAVQGTAFKDITNKEWYCYEITGACKRCLVDHVCEDMVLHISAHFSQDAGGTAMSIDVTLTAAPHVAREVLVQSISRISQRLGFFDNSEPVWSIRRRPSVVEMKSHWANTNTVSATQDHRDLEAGSLETMILGNTELRNRTRIAHEHGVEVWQYDDVDFVEPIRALFMDGQLQTTTSPVSAAHAEAMVHPALIAHVDPKSVLVISRTPSAIVKEVLKHQSVHHVSVVGSDATAMDMIQQHMPSLSDCSFLKSADSDCFDQEQIKFVDMVLTEWLSSCLEIIEEKGVYALETYYDVILVDVPIGTNDWLSPDIYQDIVWVMKSDDAILVLSSGSQPSLFEIDTENVLSAREMLLRQAARGEDHGGLELSAIHVYDETLAHPLSSTFVALFVDRGGSYARFVRKNSPMIDDDMVSRLRPSASTVVYDGPTHKGYMIPSRVWQNHYCKTIPGRNLPICQSFVHDLMDASFHHHNLDVRKDPVKGRTLYAAEDIPKGHFINPQDASLSWRIEQDQWQALNKFVEDFPEADMYRQLLDFILAYGFEQQALGIDGWGVSIACANTFINHACTKSEENVSWHKPAYQNEDGNEDEYLVFSPPFTRRAEILEQLVVTSRDIKAGDEILQNYFAFRTSPDKEYRKLLKSMCEDGVGLVSDSDGDDEL